MIIRNYGLYWKIDDVYWGKQKNAGNLFGKLSSERKSEQVNFKDQSGIYALYADYDLIYVGQTGAKGQKLLSRLRQHRNDALAGRWNKFSWFGTRSVLTKGDLQKEKNNTNTSHRLALNHMEAILITIGEPPLNRQGGKWGSNVKQYLQERDTRLNTPNLQHLQSRSKS